jgi:hypothetical protein
MNPLSWPSYFLKLAFAAAGLVALGLFSLPARADTYDDVGYTEIRSRLINKGANLKIMQVEAAGGPFLVDKTASEFSGKVINGTTPDKASAHATWIGAMIYGNTSGLAGGIKNIALRDSDTFLTTGGLNTTANPTGAAPRQLNVDLINNSWIARYGSDAANIQAVRRLDWMIDRDKVIVVNAVDNSNGDFPRLLAPSYNGITVGVASGVSSHGPIYFDSAGSRVKPDLVVTAGNTSQAAGLVSGSAAILLSEGRARGMHVNQLAVKSLLMTGADRPAGWERGAPGPYDDKRVPLDYAMGAGILDVGDSFNVMLAGEKNPGKVPPIGWDIARTSATKAKTYELKVNQNHSDLSAVLTWNREVSMNAVGINTSLADLDLGLTKRQGTRWKKWTASQSDFDNVETITLADVPRGIYRLSVSGNRVEDYGLSWEVSVGAGITTGPTSLGSPIGLPSDSALPTGTGALAVPEPTALGLLAPALLLVSRRRRKLS